MNEAATSIELPARAYRYDAFISYAHEDQKTAEWLSRLLSRFWVPWKRRRRIFLDQDSLPASGGLSYTLKRALRQSRFLIVCCSEDSQRSSWVDLEIDEFLKTHSPKNVLACMVGPRTEDPFALPHALRAAEETLADDLYKPDLRGNPETSKGPDRKRVTRDALSLLAPLVDLPGKDQLVDRRKKTVIWCVALLLLMVSGAAGWKAWDDRPQSQINKILAEAPGLVNSLASTRARESATPQPTAIADPAEDRRSVSDEWLRTLVLTGHPGDALTAARMIERADERFHALIEVSDQQSAGGAIRHYVDPWGYPSWEIVPETKVTSAERNGRNEAADEAAKTALEVVRAARGIEDSRAAFEVMITVADSLAKVGKVVEARQVAQQAADAARHIEEADARIRALIKAIETLSRAGQTDDAALVGAEAIQAAQKLEAEGARWNALSWVAGALAHAGRSAEALDTARQIEDADTRSGAMISVVQGLFEAGKYTEGRAAARDIDDPADRVTALAGVGQTLVAAGRRGEAKPVADDALDAAERLPIDLRVRFTATARVIEMLAAVGRIDDARTIALRATEPADRSRALTWIVASLVHVGSCDDARRVAEEAVAAARQMTNSADRGDALIDVAKALAGSGSAAEVSRIAHEVVAASDGQNYRQLEAMVRLLNDAGRNEEAKPIARRVFAAMRTLPADGRASALTGLDVPGLLVTAGLSPDAQQIVDAALEATQQREYEWEANRRWALVALVGALARASSGNAAVEAAGQIADPVTRVHAFLRIAEEVGRAGDEKKAKTMIAAARRIAEQLTAAADKSAAVSEVAKGLAGLHSFRSAREQAALVSPSDKLAVYTAILREYAIHEDPRLRNVLAAHVESEPAPQR